MKDYWLLAQFCTGCRTWASRTGRGEEVLAGVLLCYTGGRPDPTSRSDPDATAAGRSTIQHLHQRLCQLADDMQMAEPFLVFAAVKAIEAMLISEVDGYAAEKAQFRAEATGFRAQQERASHDPDRAETYGALATQWSDWGTASLQELKVRHDALAAWQKIMTPLLGQIAFGQSDAR